MKIRNDERALVFKNGKAVKLLAPGIHFNLFGNEIETYNFYSEIETKYAVEMLLECAEFKDAVEVIDLRDNNIALLFEHDVLTSVLRPGRHLFWKNSKKRRTVLVDLNTPDIDPSIDLSVVTHQLLQDYVVECTIEPHEKGLLFIDKTFIKELEPSTYYFWKGSKKINALKADMRLQQLDVSGQEILTKDKIMLRINLSCQYQITDLDIALVQTKGVETQLYSTVQLLLREYVGSLLLDELLQKKEEVSAYMLAALKQQETKLGVEVMFAGIKDIILPGEIKAILNQVLIAEKNAQANIITRREETASTRSLLNTAKLMEENEILYKLKELEYVEKISEKINQISLSGSGFMLDQLKELFSNASKSPGTTKK